MTKLPKKFEFCTKYNRADKYVLEYFEEGMYRYLNEDGSYCPKYTAAFVQACVDEGSWIITKNLEEPELVFPFTFTHPPYATLYTATMASDGQVQVDWEADEYDGMEYSVESAKRNIKEGIWVVKSVGEKTPETSKFSLSGKASSLTISDCGVIINGATIVDTAAHVKPECFSTLAVKVTTEGFDETMERLEKLRQAYEDVAIAMESVIALQKEMKNV